MIVIGNDDDFNDTMELLARKHERSIVFVHFLDYYINKNTRITTDFNSDNYSIEELQLFEQAYNQFRILMNELLSEKGWYDYVGEYYEAFVLAGSKASDKGQFYTPRSISDLLSRITTEGGVVYEDGTAYDPACGSARTLLDFQNKHKCNCLGEDLDESACKMAVVNFHANQVQRGQVNWIDALTREYMGKSWVVFPDKIITTDLDEIRMIQSLVGFTELCAFDLNRTLKE